MDKLLEDLQGLKDIYKNTLEFDIKGYHIKMALMTSEEETELHSYSSQFNEGLAFLYAVKRETICRAIISLNNQDIPEYIEANGERVQRHIYLRENIISGWSQTLVDELWVKYSKLLSDVEEDIKKELKTEEETSEEENSEEGESASEEKYSGEEESNEE